MKQGIAKVILRLRLDNRLSQKQLGEKLGYSQRAISDWENGNTEPNIEAIRKMAVLFDVSYEELLDS
ncbi:MAG: helix-turn-helix domain-containing protein [Firmicutes bacterium]|nr:helix-turn-helix domain-containing protein [Bacillota bacterium]